MFIVKIWGGLGNQMFQYAMGKALSIKNNTELRLDISHYQKKVRNETPRSYRLNIFTEIEESFADEKIVRKVLPRFRSEFLNSIYRKVNKDILEFNKRYIVEKESSPLEILVSTGEIFYLDGYWQMEDHFKSYRKEILDCFNLGYLNNNIELADLVREINEMTSISIHIRRGDYVSNNKASAHHGVCSLTYYQNAIAEMQKKYDGGNLKFYIFSDDIQWCIDNLIINDTHQYITTKEDYYDLYLMSICKDNIIANSSFSWWAAWLNSNQNKTVIAPAKWFISQSTKNILPKSWLVI